MSALEYNFLAIVKLKLGDYAQLIKLRLSLLVVFSAVIGFLFAGSNPSFLYIFLLSLGGLLVTGSSNAINEIIEKDIDKLMPRTSSRPLPTNRMSTTEAIVFAGITGILGILIFSIFFNTISGVLAAISLLLYGFLYTPLKRISPIAVFVGAIPGALPPAIGYVAAVGKIDYIAVLLFAIQFFWQFAHFWAIAWVAYEDYLKAGIMLLPDAGGRTKKSAYYTFMYTIVLVPIGIIPYYYGLIGMIGTVVITITALYFSYLAFQLLKTCEISAARKLMFGSFIYLPVVQLAILFDKV